MESNLNPKVNGVDVLSGLRTIQSQQFYLNDLFIPLGMMRYEVWQLQPFT